MVNTYSRKHYVGKEMSEIDDQKDGGTDNILYVWSWNVGHLKNGCEMFFSKDALIVT